MLISTFNQYLQKKHPQASAYIPDKIGKRQPNQVNIIYSPDGKIYEYKGSILSVAERLNLIPEINYETESKIIASQLKSGSTIGHNGCQDTVRYLLQKWVEVEPAGLDEFDRPLMLFKISTEENGW